MRLELGYSEDFSSQPLLIFISHFYSVLSNIQYKPIFNLAYPVFCYFTTYSSRAEIASLYVKEGNSTVEHWGGRQLNISLYQR